MKRVSIAVCLSVGCLACGEADGEAGEGEPVDSYTLRGPVQVVLDDSNVPHLYAETALDVFFAQGYQQATDTLFMLEMTKRKSNGTVSEVLGESGLEADRQARTFSFRRWGSESVSLMRKERPKDYELLVAFVGGINRRIREVVDGSAPLAAEFETHGFVPAEWTPADAMAIGFRIQVGFSSTLSFDMLNSVFRNLVAEADDVPIFAPYSNCFYMNTGAPAAQWAPASALPMDAPTHLDATEARSLFHALERLYRNHGMGEGSNNWVVRGEYTDNGRPFLANDSHAGLTDPNRMHLSHVTGGEFDAIGASFLGVPGIHVGHNRNVAWGATTNFADVMDLWDVIVDETTVQLGGETLPLLTRDEPIEVRQPDGGTKQIAFTVREVPGVGVILPTELVPVPKILLAQGEVLVGWPGFAPTDELFMFLDLDRSATLEEFEDAVDIGKTGMQNWVAATKDGIRLRVSGRVPDRGPVAGRPAANRILDGNDPGTVWSGAMLPRDRLPSLDGSQPFIVTANNDPWGHTADNDPLNDEFYYGSFYAPGFRAQRATDRLEELTLAGNITRSQMESLQTEIHSVMADGWLPLLAESQQAILTDPSLAAFVDDPALEAGFAELAAWDRNMHRESETAALFRLFTAFVSRATLEPAMSALFDGIDEAQPVTIQKIAYLVHARQVESVLAGKANLLRVQALADAIAERTKRANGGTYRWGDMHRAVFATADDGEHAFATDGDDSTLNVAQSHCWKDGELQEHCKSTGGAVYRFVIGFDADGTPNGTFVIPAANATSTEDWIEGRYSTLRFRKDDVLANQSTSSWLSP
jgi:penicillin amidase